MPTGNVTLLEATKSGGDLQKSGVVETIIQESPMIEMLPWMAFSGNALKHSEEGTLPGVQFRNVNEGYTASWGSDNEHFWGVSILGGEIKVDKYLVNVVGTEDDIEAKQWMKLGKANAMRFDYEAFKGTGSAASKGFKGINSLISEGFGQTLAMGDNGLSMSSTGAGLDKMDEAMDLFKNQGMPDAALLNRTTRRSITSAARNAFSGYSLIDVGTDVYGRQVVKYNDIPLRIMGDGINSSGTVTPILDFDETEGNSDVTSSVYFAKFGEDDVCGLLGQNGSMSVQSFGELETAPQRMGRMEWYPGIAIFNKYSIVRLTGVLA